MKIINVTKVALLALASLMLMPAQADYPDKPIGVMVAYQDMSTCLTYLHFRRAVLTLMIQVLTSVD